MSPACRYDAAWGAVQANQSERQRDQPDALRQSCQLGEPLKNHDSGLQQPSMRLGVCLVAGTEGRGLQSQESHTSLRQLIDRVLGQGGELLVVVAPAEPSPPLCPQQKPLSAAH